MEYFASSRDDDDVAGVGHGAESGIKSKSVTLRTKIKQCLENIPFDYTALFEGPPAVGNLAGNPAVTAFLQSMGIYELVRSTKYFENAELEKLLDEVCVEISQSQLFAVFLLFELIVINKDRISVTWYPVILYPRIVGPPSSDSSTSPFLTSRKSQALGTGTAWSYSRRNRPKSLRCLRSPSFSRPLRSTSSCSTPSVSPTILAWSLS